MTITAQKSRTLLYAFIGTAVVTIGLWVKYNSLENNIQTTFIIIAAALTAVLIYRSSHLGIRYQKPKSKQDDLDYKNIRLALNFQGQGKLDAAYALFKQCKHSEKVITLLKNLAQDYEIIKQPDKANIVYVHITNLQTGLDSKNNHAIEIAEKKKPDVKKSIDDNSALFNERYEIVRNIGKGTGSTIFLAKDHNNDKQLIALKILEINYDEKNALETELLARFMREAETAASLHHKNIIGVIDSGHANNVAYIAMEYIRGRSLQDYSQPKALLPQALIVELIAQCADALHYAHSRGIIHRDVKPANILYNHKDSLAKLGDFGIAHIANSTQTLAGSFLGTPFYMSPEQLGSLELDARSDELAISTVLSELEEQIPQLTPGELDPQTGYSNESLAVREAIIRANEKIYQKGMDDPECRGMGTTLVMAVLYNNQVTIAHVGDSRMYRYRSSKLEQVTVDHTFLQELVDRGYYTQEEADASLNRNLVTRALGIQPTTAVDIREDMVIPGDIYLLCSDGLTDMVDDQEISNIVSEFRDNLDKIAENLVECANVKGGRDNISVLLAQPTKAFPEKKRWNTNLKKIFGQ